MENRESPDLHARLATGQHLLSDELKEPAGVLDEIGRVLLVEISRCIVVRPPAHRLGRRERISDLIGHLSGPDEMIPESTNDAGVSVWALPFGEQSSSGDLKNCIVSAVDRGLHRAVLQQELGIGESLLRLLLQGADLDVFLLAQCFELSEVDSGLGLGMGSGIVLPEETSSGEAPLGKTSSRSIPSSRTDQTSGLRPSANSSSLM